MKKYLHLIILFLISIHLNAQESNTSTKKFRADYDSLFQNYIDTVQLDGEVDSLTLKSEFDKIYLKLLLDKLSAKQSTNKEDSLSSFFSNTGVGIAYDFHELDSNVQSLILQSSKDYFIKLIEKDVNGFWEICHSKFKESTPLIMFKESGTLIAEMFTSLDSISFLDAKKVSYSNPPKYSQFSTGGSLNQNDSLYLQFQSLGGIKDQCIVLYHLKNSPLSKSVTLKLGLEDSKYRLIHFQINTCSIGDKDAQYYMRLANRWDSIDSDFPKFFVLNLAYRLSFLGQGTMNKDIIDITNELRSLQSDKELIQEIKKWELEDDSYDIINIDFIETKNDITPNIIYLSKKELGKKLTTKEAKKLFYYLKLKYPDLVTEFKIFAFTAYEEYPAIQTKQYKYYRAILDIEELK